MVLQSPALLQLSGVGPSSVLNKAGINVNVDLPGVGLNLNEQTSTVLGYTRNDGVEFDGGGPSDTIAFPSFKAVSSDFPILSDFEVFVWLIDLMNPSVIAFPG